MWDISLLKLVNAEEEIIPTDIAFYASQRNITVIRTTAAAVTDKAVYQLRASGSTSIDLSADL